MSVLKSRWLGGYLIFLSCALPMAAGGCGSSNPNEKEFLESAPPGKPSEFPNESFSERRQRTKSKLPSNVKTVVPQTKKVD